MLIALGLPRRNLYGPKGWLPQNLREPQLIVGVRPRVSAALGAPTRKVPGASGPR